VKLYKNKLLNVGEVKYFNIFYYTQILDTVLNGAKQLCRCYNGQTIKRCGGGMDTDNMTLKYVS
jgi:hypothetical protein